MNQPPLIESIARLRPRDGTADLREKVAYLGQPDAYPEYPATVEVVQTHMSCVFLTDRHAWKLKKPVRYDFLDFSTLEARRLDCEAELRLNSRLAPDVYLGIVPLTLSPAVGLRLAGDGQVVEWLLKMRRLPRRQMLDNAIREGNVGREDVRRFASVLADFYRRAEAVAVEPREYRRRFDRDIRANREALSVPEFGLPASFVRSVIDAQLAMLEDAAALIASPRMRRRIVEGHGDLRPEHVCLGPPPLFIDCLEFNRDWRLLDPADELANLAMECRFSGAAWIGDAVFETYRGKTGDDPPALLTNFYKSYRAGLRAKLSAWHLKDRLDPADQGKWIARAARYLELAGSYAASGS